MAGRTISAHVEESVARRVEQLTKLEGRTASQIAAAALGYYVGLPVEAHAALRHIEAFGSVEDLEQVSRAIARRILDMDYDVVQRQVVQQMQVEGVDALQTEDDLLDAGVRVANRTSRGAAANRVMPDSAATGKRGRRHTSGR